MPLVSWLGRILGDERHPLHAVAVDRLDVHALAAMTSDPLEMVEIIEKAVEHRLTHAFPAGIPLEKVVSAPVNVDALDWSRSLRVAAAQRLARRVNKLTPAIRGDAARVLLRLEPPIGRRERALAELVRAGLLLPTSSASDGRLALARTVLDDDDSRIVFQDAIELPGEDRKEIDRGSPRRHVGMLNAETAPAVESPSAGQDPIAPEDVLQRYEVLRQAADAKRAPATVLAGFAELLYRSRVDSSQAAQLYERAIAAEPANAEVLQSYATFLSGERRDLDRAQELYERALAADPENPNALNNFANFLREERRDLGRAQELYERAIAADPKNASALNHFATFLMDERHDSDRAQELCERAIAADPKNIDWPANFAHALFLAGRHSTALERLREAIRQAAAVPASVTSALASELAFYRAVHLPEERDEALRALQGLVAQGARSVGWNFRAHAVLAEKAGDGDAPLFFALADVLSGKEDASTLAAIARWTQMSPVVDKK
jgi:tetratricopeptide (TPR) repeat protein